MSNADTQPRVQLLARYCRAQSLFQGMRQRPPRRISVPRHAAGHAANARPAMTHRQRQPQRPANWLRLGLLLLRRCGPTAHAPARCWCRQHAAFVSSIELRCQAAGDTQEAGAALSCARFCRRPCRGLAACLPRTQLWFLGCALLLVMRTPGCWGSCLDCLRPAAEHFRARRRPRDAIQGRVPLCCCCSRANRRVLLDDVLRLHTGRVER